MIGTRQANRLRTIVLAALQPPKFPPRRDVELAAESRSTAEIAAFSDHFWLEDGRLAVVAACLPGAGLPAALQVGSLRLLVRAALTEFRDAGQALAAARACLPAPAESGLSLAVLLADPASGLQQSATTGECFAGEIPPTGKARPEAGKLIWVAAGKIERPATPVMPVEGPPALTAAALRGGRGGAALIALLLKRKQPADGDDARSLVMANDLAEVPRLLDELEGFCTARGLPAPSASGLNVALDEALSNIVLYGFRDGGQHQICVDLRVLPERLVLEIRDDGVAFDPLQAREPDLTLDLDHRPIGGLGLHFMRSVLDDIAYHRADGWNILTMTKRL